MELKPTVLLSIFMVLFGCKNNDPTGFLGNCGDDALPNQIVSGIIDLEQCGVYKLWDLKGERPIRGNDEITLDLDQDGSLDLSVQVSHFSSPAAGMIEDYAFFSRDSSWSFHAEEQILELCESRWKYVLGDSLISLEPPYPFDWPTPCENDSYTPGDTILVWNDTSTVVMPLDSLDIIHESMAWLRSEVRFRGEYEWYRCWTDVPKYIAIRKENSDGGFYYGWLKVQVDQGGACVLESWVQTKG